MKTVILSRGSVYRCWTIGACMSALVGPVLAADEPPAKDTATAKALQKLYLADAEAYEFFAQTEKRERFEFVKQPVMHWASHDDWSGDVFVWTHRGRPQIVGCILAGPDNGAGERLFFHEFHALTLDPLPTQQLGGGRTWSLSQPAIELKPLKDAPAPADSATARLTQMRTLSREFTAIMQAGDQPWELRLLPQPVFRYDVKVETSTPRDWLDGALFTFVWTTGTDAEVLLVIEARKHENEHRWHYAPVRLTNREVVLKHGEEQVWNVPAHAEQETDITRPYTTYYVRTAPVKTTE